MNPLDELSIITHEIGLQSTFYTKASNWSSQLRSSFCAGKQPGKTTYLKILDDNLTIRMGFLYCFTGWPGSGKSEFVIQLCVLQAAFAGHKIAMYCPEGYPEDEFIDLIINCYLGKSTDRRFPNVCSEEEYDKAIEWVDKYFYFLNWDNTPDVETVLSSFKYLAENEGCTIFVIDPVNSLTSEGEGMNMAVSLKKNLTSFKRFSASKRVVTILIEHPKTPTDPKEFDHIPTNRLLFGGTMWWNKIDVGVSVHRPNREDKHDNSVIIKVWKVKKQELNGTPGEVTLHFNIKTKRYYPDFYCQDHPMNNLPIFTPKTDDILQRMKKNRENYKDFYEKDQPF